MAKIVKTKEPVITLQLSDSNSAQKKKSKAPLFCRPRSLLRACCYALPIFHPYGFFRLTWDCFIMFALIYTAIEIPVNYQLLYMIYYVFYTN